MSESRIAMIGLGQMARALAGGWVNTGRIPAAQLVGFDPAEPAARQFVEQLAGTCVLESNGRAVDAAETIVLAVKPNRILGVAREIQPHVNDRHLVISIAAGVTLAELTGALRTDRVVRVMPNTPCLVGCGALAYATAAGVTAADVEMVERLLSAVGVVIAVSEPDIDGVTGLSGSGPAYIYLMIEALSDGGVRVGLARDVATRLAAQTVLGAAQMVLQTGTHPAVLKQLVTSPGGTTIAGLEALEQHGVRAACMAAVRASTDRSMELRKTSSDH